MAGNTPWARPGAVHRAPEGAGVAPRTRGVVSAKTTHGPPPSPLWPALQAHVLSAVLPGGECEFTGQLKQEPTAEAAKVVEYAPAPQSRHVEAPVIILYFPASHAAHLPPSGPVYPGLHRQLVRRLLPLGETEYSGQLWHNSTSAEPKTALYVPAPQSVQLLAAEAPVLRRYLPAPQSVQLIAVEAPVLRRYLPAPQSVQLLAAEAPVLVRYLPASQSVQLLAAEAPVLYLPASQSVQVLSKEAPTVVEYLPLPQSVQDSFPGVALYLPASHATHVPPSGPVYPGLHRVYAIDSWSGDYFHLERLSIPRSSGIIRHQQNPKPRCTCRQRSQNKSLLQKHPQQ
jgi:hypothetical protein